MARAGPSCTRIDLPPATWTDRPTRAALDRQNRVSTRAPCKTRSQSVLDSRFDPRARGRCESVVVSLAMRAFRSHSDLRFRVSLAASIGVRKLGHDHRSDFRQWRERDGGRWHDKQWHHRFHTRRLVRWLYAGAWAMVERLHQRLVVRQFLRRFVREHRQVHHTRRPSRPSGDTDELVTGSQPKVYLQGLAASFGTNKGSGGNFTINGDGLGTPTNYA